MLKRKSLYLVILLAISVFFNSCPDLGKLAGYTKKKLINITSPANMEMFYTGESLQIKWDKIPGDAVAIELLDSETESVITTITSNTAKTGEYEWKNITAPASAEYKLKLVTVDSGLDNGIKGMSESFRISNLKWEDLGFVGNSNSRNVSIAMAVTNGPAITFNGRTTDNPNYDEIQTMQFLESQWMFLHQSSLISEYSALAVTSGGLPVNSYSLLGEVTPVILLDPAGQITMADHDHPVEIIENGENEIEVYNAFAFAMSLDHDQNPVMAYFKPIIENITELTPDEILGPNNDNIKVGILVKRWNGTDWQMEGPDSAVHTYTKTIAEEWFLYFLDGIPDYLPRLEVYTSLAIAQDNDLFLAIIEYTYPTKTMSIKKWDGNTWSSLGGIAFAGNAQYPSLAVDAGNNPIVAFSNLDNEGKGHVLKWDGSTWQDLEFPTTEPNDQPGIVIAGGFPIVASASGIKMYKNETWITLGYPNHPGNTGQGPRWITANSSHLAIAFIDKTNENKVHVKRVALSSFL